MSRNAAPPPTGRYSPLRYPGGKGKLAQFVASIIKVNRLSDGLYVEPFAGGGAVAWELLLTGIVRRVSINDISYPVYSFWRSVVERTDELIDMIKVTEVNLQNRDYYKSLISSPRDGDYLEIGFAMFFLNRTHRSGILNGGVIGGRDQTGKWKIDARYNKAELIERIERIAQFKDKISLSNLDAMEFINSNLKNWGPRTLVYFDPPYYEKGRQLYDDFYHHKDHENVAKTVCGLEDVSWIVSYDDADPIHKLYGHFPTLEYSIGYSARNRSQGAEVMFFSRGLTIPPVMGSISETRRTSSGAAKLERSAGLI